MIRGALLLRSYCAALLKHGRARFHHRAVKRWADRAFSEFEVSGDRRPQMIASIINEALRLDEMVAELDPDSAAGRRAFAEAVLRACTRLDSGDVLHSSARLRSYVDVSVETRALRAFAVYLSRRHMFAGHAANVTAFVLQELPDSRPALLAHAELLIERRQLEEAIAIIQRALRVQAVCPSAQQLLARAYAAQRQNGSRDSNADGMNYDLSDKFCPIPFTHLSTGYKGDSFICQCPAWVPYPVGNLVNATSAEAVWNSEAAAEIRRSVHDGDFKYCSRTLCSFIASQKLPSKKEITDPRMRRYIAERTVVLEEMPRMVQLNHDPSCNLACPSCRTEIITAKPGEQSAYIDSAQRVILPLLRKVDGYCYISGGGEVFASKHYLSLLGALNRRDYPDLNLYLITNGLLATADQWRKLPNLPEMIGILSVSIDAARAETYERLRRPGKWSALMPNLEAMAEMRRQGAIPRLEINFVVQEANYREIPEFIELGTRLGVDSIWLQRLTNYGSYAEPEFAKADVTSPEHPQHDDLLAVLRLPCLRHPVVNMRLLAPVLPEVVAADGSEPMLRTASNRELEEVRWSAIDALRAARV